MGRTLNAQALTLAVTGGLATGKSTVLSMLADLGAKVVSADQLVHRLLPLKKNALKRFGPGIIEKDGRINRRRLGQVVFSNPQKRKQLNSIIHPLVKKEIKRIVRQTINRPGVKLVAVEVPLLYEAGMADDYDQVLVVSCREQQQLRRTKKKFKLAGEGARGRINSQWSLGEKIKKADFVIDNSGPLSVTRRQVKEVWKKMLKMDEKYTI